MAIRALGLLLLTTNLAPGAEALPVSATAPPRNHFHWRLLPDPLDQRPGDGAAAYRDCLAAFGEALQDKETAEPAHAFLPLLWPPARTIDRRHAEAVLERFARPLELFDKAVRFERVSWRSVVTTDDEDDRYRTVAQLLPRLLRVRVRARLLADDARGAVRTLAEGFQFVRHLHEGRFGLREPHPEFAGRELCAGLLDAAGHPACPNLYAALSELPSPFFSPRPITDEVRRMYLGADDVRALFRDPVNTRIDPDRLRRLAGVFSQTSAGRATRRLADLAGEPARDAAERYQLAGVFLARHAEAKAALVRRGYAPAVVERMPPLNVGVLDLYATYEETLGRVSASVTLPYPRAQAVHQGLWDDLMDQYRADRSGHTRLREDFTFTRETWQRFTYGVLFHQRRFEVVRFAEALRLYAHETGHWPNRADDVTAVPLPIDPATMKPFLYRRDGDVAVIEWPLDPDRPGMSTDTLRLALRKPG